jgi:tetratricopeptide (TPR) repeat protein
MNRKQIDWIFYIVYSAVICLVLYLKPDFLGFESWMKSGWIILGLILFPTVYYLIARSFFREVFPVRIQINPFIPLKADNNFNGVAIAKLLELEMQPSNTGQKAQSKVRTRQESRPINIGVAGTTIPLEFLWSRIDQILFGKIHPINGIITEVPAQQADGNQEYRMGKVLLEAWSSKTIHRWRAESSQLPICDPLQTAIKYLADNIRSSFGYYQELAEKYEAQMRYDLAIRYSERISKSISLPYYYLLDGQVDKAADRFEELLQEEDVSDNRVQLIRGLALVKTAQGQFAEAQSCLADALAHHPRAEERIRCKMDDIANLRYQGKIDDAVKKLKEVLVVVDQNIKKLMGFDSRKILHERYELKYEKLGEIEKIQFYTNLLDLNEALCAMGRCARDQEEFEISAEYLEQAIDIQNILLNLGGEFYQQALGLGVLMEDLGRYDEAIEWYKLSHNDSEYLFKEDPEDISVLTNLGWSSAGLLACYVKKIRIVFLFDSDGEFSPENYINMFEQIHGVGYKLSLALRTIPVGSYQTFQAQIVEIYNKFQNDENFKIPSIDEIDEETVTKIVTLLADLEEKTLEDDIQFLLEFADWYTQMDTYEDVSQIYFHELLNRPGNFPNAEGYFGLACLEATLALLERSSIRIENAFIYLRAAFKTMPELKNRARLDEDFMELRQEKEFKKLVSWDDEVQ